MKKPIPLKSFLIQRLRRASYSWRGRSEAMKRARKSRGLYECASCLKLFKNKEFVLDHINPVVPVTGWISWDSYIDRLFCEAEGYQVLCRSCHDIKSKQEGIVRKIKKNVK